MAQVRITEEGMQKRRDDIVRLKQEINEHEAVAKEKDSPLWQRIGPIIKKSIEVNRDKLEALLSSGSVEMDKNGNKTAVDPLADLAAAKMIVGAISFGKLVLNEVEVEKVIELKRNRVARLTEELKNIQAEQGI